MRRYLPIAAVLTLVAGVAVAQSNFRFERLLTAFRGGVYIGATAERTSGNKITKSLGASSSINFAGVTDQCEDSSAITVTGAAAGDVCSVGAPATMPGTHSWVTCYVSAADAVKVRHCSHGASGDPAAATYYVRITSSQ